MAAVLTAAPLRADEAGDHYAVAAGHYAAQRWPLAVEEFRGFVKEHPSHPKFSSAVYFLGEALVQLQTYDEAVDCFRQALQAASDARVKRSAQFRVGEVAYLAGKLDKAKPELVRFLEEYPQDELNAYTLPYLGEIALAEGDAKVAEVYFQKGLETFPQSPLQDDCCLGLARVLQKQGRSDEAERSYLALSGKHESRVVQEALFRLGATQYAGKKYAEALETLETFNNRYPQSPRRATALLGCGWALVKLDRPGDAQAYFEQIAADPTVGIEARYWLGWIQKVQGKNDTAADTLVKAATAAPHHRLTAAIRFQAGDALLRAGKLAPAVEQFDRAVAAAEAGNQWLDDALRGKVQAAVLGKDTKAVDRYVSEFTQRAPDSSLKPDVQRLLAQSLLGRGEYEPARKVLDSLPAGSDGPDAQTSRYLLALAYEGLGRYDDALATLAPVLASAQGQLKDDARVAQASFLLASKRFGEATAPLEALLAAQPDGDVAAKLLGQLAVCYARTAQWEKAKKLYGEMTGRYVSHALVAPTTELLAEAALDGGDKPWANQLFARLADEDQAPAYREKGLSGLGWTQFKSGQLQEAGATFDRLLQTNPQPALAAEAALLRGQILQQLQQPDAALAMFDRVIEKYSKTERYCEALWAAARLRDELRQDSGAVDLYKRLIEAFPNFAEIDAALYRQAWALADLGRTEESLAIFQRLHSNYRQSRYWSDVTFRLAQRAFESRDYAQAEKLVGAVLDAKPPHTIHENALYLGGQIAVAGERWPQALETFELLAKTCPKSPLRLLAQYGAAEAIFRQGDFVEASRRLEQLTRQIQGRREPWAAIIPLRHAQALCQQKRWDEAHAVASTIGAEYPNFEQQFEVDYVLGRCLANRADFEKARDAYRGVIGSPMGAKTETAAKAQLMIAESYFHQKNYEAALREYLRLEILYAYPAFQAPAVMQAARCNELLGRFAEAAKLYRHVLSAYPKSDSAADAVTRLEALRLTTARRPS